MNVDAEKIIYVIIEEDSELIDVDNAATVIVKDKIPYNLSLVMTRWDFEQTLNINHEHTIDLSSVELFPFDLIEPCVNTCNSSKSSFSPVETLIEIRKNMILAKTKHSNSELIMELKQICKIAANYGYLNKHLEDKYWLEFLGHFYKIFKVSITKWVLYNLLI